MTRYCKDCTHYQRSLVGWGFYEPAKCRRPLSERREIVTGLLCDVLNADASKERRPGYAGIFRRRTRCGPEALFFSACDSGSRPEGQDGEAGLGRSPAERPAKTGIAHPQDPQPEQS